VTRLHREVLDVLLERIVSGRYPTGAMLPKEESLASEFDNTRGTPREALRALEERRVAVVKHGRGAQVQPPEEWNALDANVARALSAGRTRRRFLSELQVCRLLLETEAAALAAERASATQRAAVRVRGEELADAGDLDRAAMRLRRQVAVASGNRPLAAMLRALDEATEAPRGEDAEAYTALAEAVAAGDAEGARHAARRLNGRRAIAS
jgi:DNA-binding FadR family transcriptional regulator